MTLAVTAALHAARLQAVLTLLDAAASPATLQLYAGARPASAGGAVGAATLLAAIPLTRPAGSVDAGVLTLTQADDGLVLATGVAAWARAADGDGTPVFDCDVTDELGAGDITMPATQLYLGGAARITLAELE